jgi:hypothetical protein
VTLGSKQRISQHTLLGIVFFPSLSERLDPISKLVFTKKSLPCYKSKTARGSIMKLVSIIFVASVASTLAAERGLQNLVKKWNITDPVFTYDSLAFDLDYQVSDFIDNINIVHTLWTSPGCQQTGAQVPAGVLTSNRPGLTGQAYNPSNNGNGARDQKVTIGVVPATITDSAIYAESNTTVGAVVTATIDFCVRFSLLTDGTPVEVNYIESLVTLFVDLSDGFEIGDVNVVQKDKVQNTANQVYLLDGYQCNDANDALTGSELVATRNQGSVIRVCVKPDAEAVTAGIKMRSLDDFTFSRDEHGISQPAIIGYNLEATNGLTSLTCSNGADVCFFETILFAAFYTTAGVILGSGTGSMQLGARRLRALQDDRPETAATSEFELNFGIGHFATRMPSLDDSGAATSGVMAAIALVIGGAFALI